MAVHPAATRPPAGGAVTDTRVAALRICDDLRSGRLLDDAFESYAAVLDARNRRWMQQLVYGMLRVRARLDAVIEPRVTGGLSRITPALLDLLRLGTYQLLHMGGVPAYAAIAQSVELAKDRSGIGAGKLVNAVLRRIDRERDSIEMPKPADPIEALALEYSHPSWIVSRWVDAFGLDGARALLATNNEEPFSYARPFGVSNEELVDELGRAAAIDGVSPLLQDGARLVHGVTVRELGAFRRGMFFVQDPAATLVAHYASVPGNFAVADLCAAPGGKSLELARNHSFVVSGDRTLQRLTRLRANVAHLKADNIAIFAGDALAPPLGSVDAVLLDAPCTGTGTFRRHPDARWRLKVSDIAVMAAAQRNLIRAASAIVRPGGLLIYSTCSLEREENDAQISGLLAEQTQWQLEPPPSGAVPESVLDEGYLRVLPQRDGVDGAFAARLRKIA